MKQKTFASLAWDGKKKVTRRERFPTEMDAVIPWDLLLGLIEPHYPKGESGQPPKPLATMLRIYFMQQWFNLSDPQAEDGLYDSESMRANLISGATTITPPGGVVSPEHRKADQGARNAT